MAFLNHVIGFYIFVLKNFVVNICTPWFIVSFYYIFIKNVWIKKKLNIQRNVDRSREREKESLEAER